MARVAKSRHQWFCDNLNTSKRSSVSGKQTLSGGGGERSDIGSGHDELL